MSTPSHTNTWQFQANQVFAPLSTVLLNNQTLMLGVKNSMKGTGSWTDKDNSSTSATNNWSVTGSSDGAGNFGNGDNNDRWATTANLVWATAGSNHSWIVLQQNGINSGYQVCIDLSNATSSSGTIVVSFAAGFTGGTATARPTATDEKVLISNTEWGGTGTATIGTILNVMKTSTGSGTRIIFLRSNTIYGYWNFEIPGSAVTGWTNPSIAGAVGSSTATFAGTAFPSQAYFLTNANQWSRTGSTNFSSTCTCEGDTTNGACINFLIFINEIDDSVCFFPMGLYSQITNARGINAVISDCYWAYTIMNNGFTVPMATSTNDANARQWIVFGPLFLPWNKSKPRMRV